MALKRSSEIAGGSTFFKPAKYEDAPAVLFEARSVARDVPNTYKGVTKTRDEVTGDATIFETVADLSNGKGVELKGVTFTHPGIVNQLKNALNEQVVGQVGTKEFKNGDGWAILDVDDATFDKVAAYYEAREAAVQAALDSAPDFD